ncbi:protocatechuate 3,4-dioxygenase subunit alpha [Deinococcus aestuarii]|uniref:protocatechuate 3,4-dioxygenase subunit alpha n=1 Tax=Deinococcus aestuarii TaxID=2774531 RepID=UPI001C0D819B|nr:protocatechuate 3,4-dioxygenase subunit alpha [Deinococcus aestuarii]
MTLSPETSNISAEDFGPSPSQTVGPYFHQGLVFGQGLVHGEENVMVSPTSPAAGERVTLRGRVLDGDGEPVPDALVEVWQADAHGRYPHPADPEHAQADPHFRGFGRSDTQHPGHTFVFHTVKPGAVVRPGQPTLAPHLQLWVGMRGLLTHTVTRVFFEGEDNSADPVFASLPEGRRHTLVARREETPGGTVYHFDLRMQGEGETVFFDV